MFHQTQNCYLAVILTTEYSSCKPVTRLARLISHQITVDITGLTVPILAETKITQTQKTSRSSREESLQKLPSRRSHNRDRETNTSSNTGIKQSGKGDTHEIK